ncbi:MAG: helix-turn-helix domain-containing protein, partial [Desulfobacteraceae bacterium]|nr:helix-turn-helix domain-containing protein [Desulfobacteraceae bacterium]
KTVRKWTKRWQTAKRELSKTEVPEMNHKEYKEYCKRLIAAIGDATRPGRPIIFTAEQVVQIIAMACEVRDGSDEAISHWTWGEIVSEAVSRGIVENMSCSSAGVF